tara:strand:+ start:54 stop:242 length:189 start_codon:yes stop_codon:yes gene_type:complete
MVRDMNKPDLVWLTLINCNNDYEQKACERKPKVKELKLKNVTPSDDEIKQLEFDFEEGSNGS